MSAPVARAREIMSHHRLTSKEQATLAALLRIAEACESLTSRIRQDAEGANVWLPGEIDDADEALAGLAAAVGGEA